MLLVYSKFSLTLLFINVIVPEIRILHALANKSNFAAQNRPALKIFTNRTIYNISQYYKHYIKKGNLFKNRQSKVISK